MVLKYGCLLNHVEIVFVGVGSKIACLGENTTETAMQHRMAGVGNLAVWRGFMSSAGMGGHIGFFRIFLECWGGIWMGCW